MGPIFFPLPPLFSFSTQPPPKKKKRRPTKNDSKRDALRPEPRPATPLPHPLPFSTKQFGIVPSQNETEAPRHRIVRSFIFRWKRRDVSFNLHPAFFPAARHDLFPPSRCVSFPYLRSASPIFEHHENIVRHHFRPPFLYFAICFPTLNEDVSLRTQPFIEGSFRHLQSSRETSETKERVQNNRRCQTVSNINNSKQPGPHWMTQESRSVRQQST